MSKIDEKILIEFLNGNLPPQQVSEVEEWYMESDANRVLMEHLSDITMLDRSLTAMYSSDPSRSYAGFKKQLQGRRSKTNGRHRIPGRSKLGRIAIAALLAVTVSFSAVLGVYVAGQDEHPVVVRTNIGERTQVELADGSRIWLNACSEIKYTTPLFSKERKVELSGEAYFEVEKSTKPFIVSCDGMDVEVLGTRFNVMSNADDKVITATLMEGSINVSSPFIKRKNGLNMKPRDQLVINRLTGNTIITSMHTAEHAVSWIDGTMSFNGNTFEQIARTLERNYNIEILFKDEKVKQSKFICDFSTTDNIYRIMSILGMTEKFDYRVDGRKIEIQSR